MDKFTNLTEAYEQVLTNEGFFDRAKATGSKFIGSTKQLGKNIKTVGKAGLKGISGDSAGAKAELGKVDSISKAGNTAAEKSLLGGVRRDLKISMNRAVGALNDTNSRITELLQDQSKMGVDLNSGKMRSLSNVQKQINVALKALEDAKHIAY